MDRKSFARFCARIEGMSVGQVRESRARLGRLRARTEARARIDRRGEALAACLHSGASWLVRSGDALCSDGDGVYDLFARRRWLPHYRFNASTGPRVIDTAFHIQTVNNLHGRLNTFLRPFCGPATKKLPRHLGWFLTRLSADPASAAETAWKRMLAT